MTCAVGQRPGREKRRGRTADEVVGSTFMKGSNSDFQKAIVPPIALLDTMGRSGHRRSSLLR